MRISDWSSDVCSSDLKIRQIGEAFEVVFRLAIHCQGECRGEIEGAQGITIGLRVGNFGEADLAARPGHVPDDHRSAVAPGFLTVFSDSAGHNVGPAARRISHAALDWLLWICRLSGSSQVRLGGE